MKLTALTLRAIAHNLIATDGPLEFDNLFMGVYTAIADHGQDTVLADITEGTDDLGLRYPITTGDGPLLANDGLWYVECTPATFELGAGQPNQVVLGFFLVDAEAEGNLLGWEPLPAPMAFSNQYQRLDVVLRLAADPDGRWSASISYGG